MEAAEKWMDRKKRKGGEERWGRGMKPGDEWVLVGGERGGWQGGRWMSCSSPSLPVQTPGGSHPRVLFLPKDTPLL